MPNFENKPKEEALKLGSLTDQEMTIIFSELLEEKELWYARMLDRYHEMYALERELIAQKADDAETRPINLDRDRLHKQIEKLGRDFGKTKEMVLADVMAREGNLGEFLLPEYGIMTPEQVMTHSRLAFPGLDNEKLRQGTYCFSQTTEEVLGYERSYQEREAYREPIAVREGFVRGLGERSFVSGILPHEIVVIFGAMFTVDIHRRSVEIEPPGFPEKFRRAARVMDILREKDIDAKLFNQTLGGYHDTTTVVGVVIPANVLESDLVGLLRNNRGSYGIRSEDLRLPIVEQEYQDHLQGIICPLSVFDLMDTFAHIREEDRSVVYPRFQQTQAWVMQQGQDFTIEAQMRLILEAYPEYEDRKDALPNVLTMMNEQYQNNFREPFHEVHQRYFGHPLINKEGK